MNSKHDNKKPEPIPNEEQKSAILNDYIKDFRKIGFKALASMSKHEQSVTVTWAQDVFEAYGKHLKENPMKIHDCNNLPYPKEDIKIAIKTLLLAYVAKQDENMIRLLKDRFVRLSEFQEIRQEDIATISKEASAIEQKPTPTEISHFPTYHRYMQIAVSEQKILIGEINNLVKRFQTKG